MDINGATLAVLVDEGTISKAAVMAARRKVEAAQRIAQLAGGFAAPVSGEQAVRMARPEGPPAKARTAEGVASQKLQGAFMSAMAKVRAIDPKAPERFAKEKYAKKAAEAKRDWRELATADAHEWLEKHQPKS